MVKGKSSKKEEKVDKKGEKTSKKKKKQEDVVEKNDKLEEKLGKKLHGIKKRKKIFQLSPESFALNQNLIQAHTLHKVLNNIKTNTKTTSHPQQSVNSSPNEQSLIMPVIPPLKEDNDNSILNDKKPPLLNHLPQYSQVTPLQQNYPIGFR
ncbi:MAG: hypothetical protein EZS28_001780 [Streblomastix strix]|uniref:Uncharacterized protein n=1 Tax=Streblomastix strix TaxID=222440 RepID=A0A5J4X691_9EUKA|nr:MAG: hypothetical protein EZS28_001780 [Streblomastix strix]